MKHQYFKSLLFVLLSLCLNIQCDPHPAQAEETTKKSLKIHEKEVVTFVYHRFDEPKYPSTNISASMFYNHLRFLKENNFRILTFGQAIKYLNSDQPVFEEKVACITIDDGFQSYYDVALPLLKEFGFKATVFVNTQSVSLPAYMSWITLKEIERQGYEIGNHSHSHMFFLDLPIDSQPIEFANDIRWSQQLFKKHLGHSPNIFAYPYGEFSPALQKIIKSMGFVAAAAQNSGVMRQYNLFALPRFPVAGNYARMAGFKEKANSHAWHMLQTTPISHVIKNSMPPIPTLKLLADTSLADISRMNCFAPGGCNIKTEGGKISVKANKSWTGRRALYTLTAPAKAGSSWYWYSFVWIQPKFMEK